MSAAPRPQRGFRFDSVRTLVLAIVVGALAGCARELPVAPGDDPAMTDAGLRHISGGRFLEGGGGPIRLPGDSDDASGGVVLSVLPGASLQQIAVDYQSSIVREVEVGGAAFGEVMPPTGELPESLLVRMEGDPRVVLAEPGIYLETAEARQESFAFDDGFGTALTAVSQPSLRAMNVDVAHRVSRGAGVLVAVLDTGVDPGHPLLAGRIRGGWDFVDGDADPRDVANGLDDDGDGLADEALGHGTHVAGIVAMMAPSADLLIVRVLDAEGRGDLPRIAAGIRWAVDHGARVINLSFGSLRGSNLIQDLLEQAENTGVVSVAAAGNWGSDKPEEYPAESSHAIGVSAVDSNDHPASFSSYGGHIDLSAPGVNVRSAFAGGRYALWSGTSMSVPFVSGAAALLLAVHPGWTQLQVENRLFYTARPVLGAGSLAEFFGAGVLDAGAALSPDAQPSDGDGDGGGLRRGSPGP